MMNKFIYGYRFWEAFELQPRSLWRPAAPLGLGLICLLLFVLKAMASRRREALP